MIHEEDLKAKLISLKPRDKYWMVCDKCGSKEAQKQICQCPACSKVKDPKKRSFVHLNEPCPKTIDWTSLDEETKIYSRTGCYDSWSLCNDCSKRLQIYADWSKPHPDLLSI